MRSSSFSLLLAITLGSCALLSGCSLWKPSAKAPKPKALGIAASNATLFRERWLAQRTAALIAIGTPAASAPAQAQADFEKEFSGLVLK